jgi:NAD(P)-dependent dehydrogenase (short-subunit alcohol dehydrogenase family)
MTIDSKTVLVTGSTDGVGRLVALRLADQGARVLVHGRDRQRGDQVVEQIRNSGHSAVFLPADFSSLSEVRRLADAVRQECNRVDMLINNAGIGSGGSAGKREVSQDGYELRFAVRVPAHSAVATSSHGQQTRPHRERLLARSASD